MRPTEFVVRIEPDGSLVKLQDATDAELDELGGTVTYRRVSNIWPVNPVKRIAFRLLRLLFGSRGRVAQWTRTWHGPWMAIIKATGQTFTHPSRQVCLAWEHQIINYQLANDQAEAQ